VVGAHSIYKKYIGEAVDLDICRSIYQWRRRNEIHVADLR